ncbi:hypothetical protein MHZ95_17525 [Sporosarcina sp. ACRSM]|uniref:hypothetical protein n=1 Tax=Sporosarcina sp. ACRSM TaxID=2918216 RepID=UPI001EF46F31|nr:hypothetical protein [Sporosarcina sp. ACRSM]MCG7337063.1 hypothetical protein [Sporosarcina sp. ACRSM]
MVSIYMKFFAQSLELDFNDQLLSQNISYLRNALVMASIGEYDVADYPEMPFSIDKRTNKMPDVED